MIKYNYWRVKMKYRGIIIEESLNDNRILNNINILKLYITEAAKRSDQWHLFEVEVEENEIEKISKLIIEGWYTHFLHGSELLGYNSLWKN